MVPQANRPIFLVIGLLMCIYPYFISNLLLVWLLTALLLIPAWALRNT
jgi:membrane protein implicated in regulation of membrane protease activity